MNDRYPLHLMWIPFLGAGLLISPASGEPPLGVRQQYRIAQDVASEILARRISQRYPDVEPTRYEVSEILLEFMETLENLQVLSGQRTIEPIRSNPQIRFEKASRRALERIKSQF